MPLSRRRNVRIPLVYVLCEGCYDVTAHLSGRVTTVSLPPGPWRAEFTSLVEIICRTCGWAQPRVVGDEVVPNVLLECRRDRQLFRRQCRRTFTAPPTADWPTCPWCGASAWPVPS